MSVRAQAPIALGLIEDRSAIQQLIDIVQDDRTSR